MPHEPLAADVGAAIADTRRRPHRRATHDNDEGGNDTASGRDESESRHEDKVILCKRSQ